MAQYDVHLNASEHPSATYPYLLEVQSNLFVASSRVVIVPLVSESELSKPDSTLNPEFTIGNDSVFLLPLDISSADKLSLGESVASLAIDSDRIVAALDLLFARYCWKSS